MVGLISPLPPRPAGIAVVALVDVHVDQVLELLDLDEPLLGVGGQGQALQLALGVGNHVLGLGLDRRRCSFHIGSNILWLDADVNPTMLHWHLLI